MARSRTPIAVILAYVQVSLIVLAAYIFYDASQKPGKESWGALLAIVPAYVMAALSPVYPIMAGFYFYRWRDEPLSRKVLVGVACLLSILAFSVAI